MEALRLEEPQEPYAKGGLAVHLNQVSNFAASKLQVEVREVIVAAENSRQDVAVIVVRLVEVVVRTYLT